MGKCNGIGKCEYSVSSPRRNHEGGGRGPLNGPSVILLGSQGNHEVQHGGCKYQKKNLNCCLAKGKNHTTLDNITHVPLVCKQTNVPALEHLAYMQRKKYDMAS